MQNSRIDNFNSILSSINRMLQLASGNLELEVTRKTQISDIDELDSLGFLNFISEFEQKYSLQIDFDRLTENPSIEYFLTLAAETEN